MAKLTDLSALAGLLSEEERNRLENERREREARKPRGEGRYARVVLDTKSRRGKTVTVIETEGLSEAQMAELGRDLKAMCATGGTVKASTVELQGDKLRKVTDALEAWGFTLTK